MDTSIIIILIIIAAIALLMGKVQEWVASILAPIIPGLTSLGNAFNSGARTVEILANNAEQAVEKVGIDSAEVIKAKEEIALLEVQNQVNALKAKAEKLKAENTKPKATKPKAKTKK